MLNKKSVVLHFILMAMFSTCAFSMEHRAIDISSGENRIPIEASLDKILNELEKFLQGDSSKENLSLFLDTRLPSYEKFFQEISNQKISSVEICLAINHKLLKRNLLVNLAKYYREILKTILKDRNSVDQFKEEFLKISKSILLSSSVIYKMPSENIEAYENFLVLASESIPKELRGELGNKFLSNLNLNIYNWGSGSTSCCKITCLSMFLIALLGMSSVLIRDDEAMNVVNNKSLALPLVLSFFLMCTLIFSIDKIDSEELKNDLAIHAELDTFVEQAKNTRRVVKEVVKERRKLANNLNRK